MGQATDHSLEGSRGGETLLTLLLTKLSNQFRNITNITELINNNIDITELIHSRIVL